MEEERGEWVRSEVKRLWEEAWKAERTGEWRWGGRADERGRQDFRRGYFRRDLGARLELIRGLWVPRSRLLGPIPGGRNP